MAHSQPCGRFMSVSSTKGLWLFCLSVLYVGGHQRHHVLPPSCENFGPLQPRRRRLILDGLVLSASTSCDTSARQCSLYLVFKEPRHPSVVRLSGVPYRLRFCFDGVLQGNLARLPRFSLPRQPFFRRRTGFSETRLLSSWGLSLAASAFDRRHRVKRV